jgi:hypothetical protein
MPRNYGAFFLDTAKKTAPVAKKYYLEPHCLPEC